LVGAGAATILVVSALPLLAADAGSTTSGAVADTSISMVPQDGDNRGKTTLASCPQLCDGNRNGQREPFLEFAVAGLPANAANLRATLRVYAWSAFAARMTAYPAPGGARSTGAWADHPTLGAALDTNASVVKGYNEFDVSAAVRGNGTYTFAMLQETLNTRIYWASRENTNASIRPQLVVTYTVSTPPPTTAPPTTRPPTTPPPTTPPPTTGPPTTPPPTQPAGWRLVWNDEFNGSGAVDRAKWNLRNEGRNTDIACNTSRVENQFQGNGLLTIRAIKEPWTCAGGTRQYTEGYLDTIGKFSWTYGRFEVRAKSPNGPTNSRGLWPAFWLRPNDGGNGEIDVVELPGGANWYRDATYAIFYNYTPIKQDVRPPWGAGYPGDGFHTYTTEWEPGVLRWYVDGREVWRRDRTTTSWFDEVFNKPYNLRLNFQVGGWLGNPDATTVFPADFQVDYVRVYQR
jgi:beta-glucanase (GH16 family)